MEKKRNKLKPTKSGILRVKERTEIEDIWAIFYFLRYMQGIQMPIKKKERKRKNKRKEEK